MSIITSDPWERQPGETSKAFAAFVYYRDTPAKDRSLRKCAAAFLKDQDGSNRRGYASVVRQWMRWSSRFSWVERSIAWDMEQDRISIEDRKEKIKEMNERHIKFSKSLQQQALEALQKLRVLALESNEPILHPRMILRFITEAAKLERLAMGVPDTISEISIDWKKELENEGYNPSSIFEDLVQEAYKKIAEQAIDKDDKS